MGESVFTIFLSYLLPNQVRLVPRHLSFKIIGGLEEKRMGASFPNWMITELQNLTGLGPHTVRNVHLILKLGDKECHRD